MRSIHTAVLKPDTFEPPVSAWALADQMGSTYQRAPTNGLSMRVPGITLDCDELLLETTEELELLTTDDELLETTDDELLESTDEELLETTEELELLTTEELLLTTDDDDELLEELPPTIP